MSSKHVGCLAAATLLWSTSTWAAPTPQSGCSSTGPWTAHGQGGGGHVSKIVVDPNDASGQHLFVGTDVSGVFESCDGGSTWRGGSRGMTNTYVQDLVVKPGYPLTLFAATLDGISRSDDGGQTWQTDFELRIGTAPDQGLPDQRPYAGFAALSFDTFDPDVLYAGVGTFRFDTASPGEDPGYSVSHVWRRVQSGGSAVWEPLDSLTAKPWTQAVAVHSIESCFEFDGAHVGADMIMTSTTAGVSLAYWNGSAWQWTSASTGLPHLDCRELALERDAATGNPTRAFLVLNAHSDGVTGSSIYDHGSGYGGGVWVSNSIGATWSPTSFADGSDGFHLEARNESLGSGPCPPESATKNMRHIALDPVHGYVYVGLNQRSTATDGVWRASTTTGAWAWEHLSVMTSGPRCLDGIQRFANIDFDTFTTIGKVEDMAVVPSTGRAFFSTNMGVYACDALACDPTQEFGARWGPLHTTTTPGNPTVFRTRGLDETQITQVQSLPESPNVWLLAEDDHGILRSDDGGDNWRYVGQANQPPYATYNSHRCCNGLFRNPGHPEEWFGIFGTWNVSNGGPWYELWRTTGGVPNDASTWTRILPTFAGIEHKIRDVLFLDGDHVLVAAGDRLWRAERDLIGNWSFGVDEIGIPTGMSRAVFDLVVEPGSGTDRRTLVALSQWGPNDGGILYRDHWADVWVPATHVGGNQLRSVHKIQWSDLGANLAFAGRGSTGSTSGGGAFLRSTDGGATWETPAGQDFGADPASFHVSQLVTRLIPLAAGGSIERIYAGLAAREGLTYQANWFGSTFGGIFSSDDNGATWTDRSAGLDLGLSSFLGRDAGDPYRILYGTKGNGVHSLTDVVVGQVGTVNVKGGGLRITQSSQAYYCPYKFTNLRNQATGGQQFIERGFLQFPLSGLPASATVTRVELLVDVHDGANSPATVVELKRLPQPLTSYNCNNMNGNGLYSSINSTTVYTAVDGWTGNNVLMTVDLGPLATSDVQAALSGSGSFQIGLRLQHEGSSFPNEVIELAGISSYHKLIVHYEP